MTFNIMDYFLPEHPPYAHQLEALKAARDHDGFALIMEMGTGKTKVCIDNYIALYRADMIDGIVVQAPKNPSLNWAHNELPIHIPKEMRKYCQVHMWGGGHTQKERRALQDLLKPGPNLRILVVNVEAISMSKNAWGYVEKFVRSGRVALATDESTCIGNPDSIRAKKSLILRDHTVFRRIMTGLPSPNGPLALWSQYEMVQRQCLGFKNFFAFKKRYAIVEKTNMGGRLVPVVVGYRNVNELPEKMAPHSFYAKKKDCLDLPDKIYMPPVEIDMTKEQVEAYQSMKKYAISILQSGEEVTAKVVTTILLRLHQIACGHVMTDDGNVVDLPSRRVDALEEILDETDENVIVWAQYRRDLHQIEEMLRRRGERYGRFDGSTPTNERQRIVSDFQAGKLRVFASSLQAGATAITLTRATCVVYFSNSYNLELREQSEDRAHRIGQRSPVTYTDILARGTVDSRILKSLMKKRNMAHLLSTKPTDLLREIVEAERLD